MHKIRFAAAAVAALMLVAAAPSQAQQDQSASDEKVEEIVVTGTRSGIPLWRVKSADTTLILVGAIEGVSKTTKWDPEALTDALRMADRVMYPQAQAFTVGSPFKLIGWFAKFKAMGSLPKEQSLAQFVAPDHLARLAALEARGAAPKGYLRRHPLHLSNELRERARGRVDLGPGASAYVQKAIRKHKLEVTVDPIAKSKAKPVVKDLFASEPQEHVPCLIDSIALAEAGPAAVQARSDGWAARRVKEVIASPADKVFASCWPNAFVRIPTEDVLAQMRHLLGEKQVTVAVLSVRTLAESGGILDGLEAAGFEIRGPAWK